MEMNLDFNFFKELIDMKYDKWDKGDSIYV